MPNYGKQFTALKKRVETEKKRHMKKGNASFGSCACDKIAEEAHNQAQKAAAEGKFGKANAFGKLAFGSSPRLWEVQGPFYNAGYN